MNDRIKKIRLLLPLSILLSVAFLAVAIPLHGRVQPPSLAANVAEAFLVAQLVLVVTGVAGSWLAGWRWFVLSVLFGLICLAWAAFVGLDGGMVLSDTYI